MYRFFIQPCCSSDLSKEILLRIHLGLTPYITRWFSVITLTSWKWDFVHSWILSSVRYTIDQLIIKFVSWFHMLSKVYFIAYLMVFGARNATWSIFLNCQGRKASLNSFLITVSCERLSLIVYYKMKSIGMFLYTFFKVMKTILQWNILYNFTSVTQSLPYNLLAYFEDRTLCLIHNLTIFSWDTNLL